jgi:uncharacterized glyoxalase superfamily protein PhnB
MSEQKAPTIVPFLAYEEAAIEFLTEGFGFTVTEQITNDDGSIGHATLALGSGLIYLADFKGAYEGPTHHAETCERARAWQQTPYIINGVHVQVDDVHKHFEQAKAAGATILSEIEDAGHGVIYRAADPEGQRWMFSQR